MSKLFLVTIETEIPVYADDGQDAREIAEKAVHDLSSYDFSYFASELTSLKFVDAGTLEELVFGADNDKTVKELFEELHPETTETP